MLLIRSSAPRAVVISPSHRVYLFFPSKQSTIPSVASTNPHSTQPDFQALVSSHAPKRAMSTTISSDVLRENIFLFVPNLIGYARVLLLIVSCYFMPFCYLKASILYGLSAFLDAFDGYAARRLNQSTKFGAILDQITDRCGLLALLSTLITFYPKYAFYFQLSMLLDISSHWIHIWSSLMKGKTSHKFIDPSENVILKHYYTSRSILFAFCAANEMFYGGMYILHFTEGPALTILDKSIGVIRLMTYISAPVSIVKSFISIIQLLAACANVGIIDTVDRVNERASRSK